MSTSSASLTYNDGVLAFSLLYSCFDIYLEWDNFAACRRPIHKWLIVSYFFVLTFRAGHIVGNAFASAGDGRVGQERGAATDFLLDLRPKTLALRTLVFFNWLMFLPAFIVWTLVGAFWQYQIHVETPTCMPSDMHLWFCWGWLLLCGVSVGVHTALGVASWMLERRVRRAEGDLRQIEDSEVLARWGQVSNLAGFQSLSPMPEKAGLTPAEIRALPGETSLADDVEGNDLNGDPIEERECTICLGIMHPGDCVRHLSTCGHTFHRPCIDLWLLRSAECPLCKRSARLTTGMVL